VGLLLGVQPCQMLYKSKGCINTYIVVLDQISCVSLTRPSRRCFRKVHKKGAVDREVIVCPPIPEKDTVLSLEA